MCVSLRILVACAALSVSAAFGQSLSIKKVDTLYSIDASAPADNPGALQATEDFRLWIDLTNQFTDQKSFLLKYSHISSRYFRLIPSPPELPPIRIAALGDSLITDEMGWGGGIYGFLKPNATFINYAWPGNSTVNAILTHLDMLSLIKPKYVIFEFGTADMALGVTEEEFEGNLKTIVNGIRSFDGVPFLVTVHCLRTFDGNGNFIPYDLPYNSITRKVAREMNAPLIDLNKMLGDLYTRLGPGGSEFMKYIDPRFPNDTTHFSPLGAVWVSQLVLKALPDLGPYLTEKILDPPPNP